MASTSLPPLAPPLRFLSRLALSAVALAVGAGCDLPDPVVKEVQEVAGEVAAYPGAMPAPDASGIQATRFRDDVGPRAYNETRALITSAAAYRDYFGHAPPASVAFPKEWVIFYAPGKKGSAGYQADVRVLGAKSDTLHVVTTLTAPIPPCAPPMDLPATMPGSTPPAGPMGSGPTTSASGTGGAAGSGTGPSSGPTTPNNAGAPAPTPPATTAPPMLVPPSPPALIYALVKIPAQRTSSVDFQHQDIVPRCGGGGRPDPARCTSSEQCQKGLRCSTERGDCQGCGAGPEVACPAVCFGVCEPATPTPPTSCDQVKCMPGSQCVLSKSLPPQATCVPQDPMVNPCAATLCPAGTTCVVRESFPPQAACVPIQGPSCMSSGDCKDGLVCSTEIGVCGANPACMPGAPCDTACHGTCIKKPQPPEPGVCTGGALMGACQSEAQWKEQAAVACRKLGLSLTDFGVGAACTVRGFAAAKYTCCGSAPTPPPPAVCKTDSDCALTSNACGSKPCTCSAYAVNVPQPDCAMPAIACLVDPCREQVAACEAGQCVVRPRSNQCEWSYFGDPAVCKPYDTWKQMASDACKAKGKVLTNISPGGMCAGGINEIKYECCPTR
jgi:Copper-binding of amyloid precursor, CuBD